MIKSELLEKAYKLHKENKLDDAEKYYLEAIEQDPDEQITYNLLGSLYFQKNNLENAEIYFRKAFSLKEDSSVANNLGKVYIEKKEYAKAIEILKKGIEINSQNYSLWFDLGLAYRNNNEWVKSKEAYKKALEINPRLHEAYFNLAYLCFNDNEPFEAVHCYEKALEMKPDEIDTMYFLSLAYMQTKNYEKGLEYFESRLCRASSIISQEKTYPNLAKPERIWQGEDLSDKTIYTYYEAGFGDVIMFARYLNTLAEKCKKVIFKPQSQLVTLFQENYPNIEVHKYFKEEKDIYFDVHLPILSLPYALALKGEDMFMGHEGYLKANQQKAKDFKNRIFNNDKFKIGIKWQGNTYYDLERVITIDSFFKLMDLENTQFYSCQTYEGAEEYNKIPEKYNVINLADEFKDFSDTTAAVENMDLIICNDTSLAHIAGAIGKPCWVILPHVYNWRWHLDLNKCDWYDSVKIFRQNEQGNWAEVFDRIETELKKLV